MDGTTSFDGSALSTFGGSERRDELPRCFEAVWRCGFDSDPRACSAARDG